MLPKAEYFEGFEKGDSTYLQGIDPTTLEIIEEYYIVDINDDVTAIDKAQFLDAEHETRRTMYSREGDDTFAVMVPFTPKRFVSTQFVGMDLYQENRSNKIWMIGHKGNVVFFAYANDQTEGHMVYYEKELPSPQDALKEVNQKHMDKVRKGYVKQNSITFNTHNNTYN